MESGRIDNVLTGPKLEASFIRDGIGAFLFENAKKHAHKISQVCVKTGKEETYEELNRRTIYAALEMKKRRVKRNDVIGYCSVNSLDSAVVLAATFYLGARLSPLDSYLSLENIVAFLEMVTPKILFVGVEAVKLIERASKQIKVPIEIVVLHENSFGFKSFLEYQKPVDDWKRFTPVIVPDDRETAFVLFSSGSTGVPKGICISHYAMLRFAENDLFMKWKTDAILDSASLFWTVGIALTLESFWTGGKRVLLDNFQPNIAAKIIQDFKVTMTFINSTYMYQLTEENTTCYDTSCLHTVQVGGSKLSPEQHVKTMQYFPKSIVALSYGMTEAGVLTSFSRFCDLELIRKKPGSCGKLAPNTKLKIVDLYGGGILGPNKIGEIRIQSEAMFNGYHELDTSEFFDSDGWFKTGDVGYYDDDDCVYICDRLKEVFKYQDWHVFPAQLERILYQHSSVKEAIVIGVPHPTDGEHGVALVVPNGNDANRDDLLNFIDERVADYEKLRGGVKFVDDFPRTSNGKFKRKMIRDMYLNGKI